MRRLVGLILLLGLAGAIVAGWQWWGPGPLARPTRVVVPDGASLALVAAQLDRDDQIGGSAGAFRLFARLLGSSDPVQAGEFELPARASAATILDTLQHGRPVVRLVTVPEGMPAILVAEKLAAVDGLSGPVPPIAEGSVLPDSYAWQAGDTRAALVARMQAAMDKTLAAAWAKRSPRAMVKSPHEAIILASIVEKETGKASERRQVAGVLSNRLRIGMALGADATSIYPVTRGKPLGRMIRKSELVADNGYNTRLMRGLPVGPISNPGRDSIAAVLDPAPTNALYYVADGSGGHLFADTLAQHNANVARWRALRRERGI